VSKPEFEPEPFGFRVMPDPRAVSDARRRVVAVIRRWPLDLTEDELRTVELLSSEVITNAVRYTRAPCAVVVRWTGVRVRVEVTDVDPVRPRPRDASQEAENGRGLLLVETLATMWGSAPDPAGKVVWFEVGPSDVAPPAPGRQLVNQVRAAFPFGSPAGRLSRSAVGVPVAAEQ